MLETPRHFDGRNALSLAGRILRGLHVDLIGADAEAADGDQVGRLLQQSVCHLRLRADAEHLHAGMMFSFVVEEGSR